MIGSVLLCSHTYLPFLRNYPSWILSFIRQVAFTFTWCLPVHVFRGLSPRMVSAWFSLVSSATASWEHLVSRNKVDSAASWAVTEGGKESEGPWLLLLLGACLVAQSCPTLCDPMDCNPPGSSVHGILQSRILEWVVISFCRGSSQPKDQTQVSCIAGGFFTSWVTREAHF